MTTSKVCVPFGKDKDLTFGLPSGWEIIGVCEPNPVPPCQDVPLETARALDAPVSAPPLEQQARGARRVVVVVDDLSRPTPVHRFFLPVMERIEKAGVAADRITILFALGVHRDMTDAEMATRIGPESFARYRCVNHQASSGDHLAHLGSTSRGSPIWVNRLVAQADLVVSLGCIEPHSIAGFGGGYKNLFPGVAGKVTIAANHALNTTPAHFNSVGTVPKGNPMRCDLEECGSQIPGKVFLVNAILDGYQRVVRIVTGDPIGAHREGIELSRKIFGVSIPKPADVVISSSHPFNIDLRAGFKALSNLLLAARPNGVLINLIVAEQGLGDMTLPKRKIYAHKPVVRKLTHAILPMVRRFNFGLREEDKFFVYFGLQAMKRNHLFFYSPNMPEEFARRLAFMDFHNKLETVLEKARRILPNRASVLVFPRGGVTYPILPKPNGA